MDLDKAIRQLYEQRAKLDRVIATLEDLLQTPETPEAAPKKRRGRKFMDAAARKEVSERMRRYWEARRREKQKQAEAGEV